MKDSSNFDPLEALTQQIELLELQYKHIGELISFAREIRKKGVREMNFHVFNKSEIEQYKVEAKAKWGDTKEYQEYEQKQKSGHDFSETTSQLMNLFIEIGALRQLSPTDKAVQERIGALQNFITSNYYTCNTEISCGLGQMYVSDERFKHNIDKVGGEDTAEFVKQAIEIYCSKEKMQWLQQNGYFVLFAVIKQGYRYAKIPN